MPSVGLCLPLARHNIKRWITHWGYFTVSSGALIRHYKFIKQQQQQPPSHHLLIQFFLSLKIVSFFLILISCFPISIALCAVLSHQSFSPPFPSGGRQKNNIFQMMSSLVEKQGFFIGAGRCKEKFKSRNDIWNKKTKKTNKTSRVWIQMLENEKHVHSLVEVNNN